MSCVALQGGFKQDVCAPTPAKRHALEIVNVRARLGLAELVPSAYAGILGYCTTAPLDIEGRTLKK